MVDTPSPVTLLSNWRARAAVLIAAGVVAAGAAPAEGATFKPCRRERLSAHDPAGQALTITKVLVDRLPCASADAAIRASSFAATPGGPLFTTPGFTCTGPVGPPPPGSKPRYYRCTRGRTGFEFTVAGFS
jgi:hypothetical protein